MAATPDHPPPAGGGYFLFNAPRPSEVFTREDLSPAQQMFGRVAAEFMRAEVLPRAEEIYAKDWALTRELLLKAGELDLLRVDIPEAFDGLGLDKVSSAYVGEQIGVMPSFAGSLGAHTTIGTLPLVYFGTGEQKARYLPRLASGEWVAAYALTEPGSGSDALAARARATLSGDGTHYVLSGQKMWITNGGFADLFTVFAKVDGEHFTAFLVERAMGLRSGREEPKLGLDGSSTTALILDGARVPAGNVLGKVGEGHRVAFNALNLGRLKLGARNIGSAKQAVTRAATYAAERQQFGRPIAEFGMIRQKLGEMAARCFVGDAMVYRTLGDVDRALASVAPEDFAGALKAIEGFAVECSINKVWTSEALAHVVDESLQVFGGYGYSREYPAERAYRDARITRIYEGTNEINRLIIPTHLLKGAWAARLPETAGRVDDVDAGGRLSPGALFPAERALLARAKRLAALTLARAREAYGDRLAGEQEVLGHAADVIAEVYALESALLRAEKMAARGAAGADSAADVARLYASDASDRLRHSARQVAAALAPDDAGHAAEPLLEHAHDLTRHPPYNTVAARRRLADAVVRAGRYHL